jgi:hypothetical protein
MRTLFFLFSILLIAQLSSAQNYLGLHSSRLFPLQNLSNQPADLVMSKYKWNINLVSGQIALLNNLAFNEPDMVKRLSTAGIIDLKYILGAENSRLYVNGRFMLPSVSYSINKNHAVALSTNFRGDAIYRASSNEMLNLFKGVNNPELLENLSDEYFKTVLNSWMEYNATYSGVIFNKGEHQLNGGITIKYLVGGASAYIDIDDIEVKYNKERIETFDVHLSYAFNKSIYNTVENGTMDLSNDHGFGLDLGISYIYKPDNIKDDPKRDYLIKAGFFVSDLGSVKNKSEVRQGAYNIAVNNLEYSSLMGVRSLEALVDTLKDAASITEDNSGSYTMDLPLSIGLTADYNFRPNWYIFGSFAYQPQQYARTVDILLDDIYTTNITARYETNKLGAYLPITYSNLLGWNAGIGFSYRYFYIGSSTILSNLVNPQKGMGEFYFGLNIPLGKIDKK